MLLICALGLFVRARVPRMGFFLFGTLLWCASRRLALGLVVYRTTLCVRQPEAGNEDKINDIHPSLKANNLIAEEIYNLIIPKFLKKVL